MIKRFAILSLAVSATLAQTSNNSTSNSTADPLIPSGISQACNSFLVSLDKDSTLLGCTSSLLGATKPFGPGQNATAASSSAITTAIGTICSSSTDSACPQSYIGGKLAEFRASCAAELVDNPVQGVIAIYDVLYVLNPFRKAICSKDDSDNYCLLQKTNSSFLSGVKSNYATQDTQQELLNALVNKPELQKRAAATQAVTPNFTTFHDTNLVFLFLRPDMDSATLCTTCTRQIFNSYFNFETLVPFAAGLSASKLLGGQMDLYKGIQGTCGPNFLQTSVQAAGGISGGTLFSGSIPTVDRHHGMAITVTLSLVTLAIASFL